LLGCGIPAIIIYLVKILNTTVRGRKDIEDATDIPILGEVPEGDKNADKIILSPNDKDNISEAYRIIRTNLDFMTIKNDMKVIMLTSTRPGEGKTFTSLNLSMSLVIAGKKVILIDMDLRIASFSKKLNTNGYKKG
jgi:Mrp family chromosome partitioning ATPase